MTRRLKIGLGLLAVVALAFATFAVVKAKSAGDMPSHAAPVVRADSHRLTDVPDGKATFVEFLDFECEACLGLYPVVEELRREYGDRVSFVIRYFPMPGHFNSGRAARSVEAAARQGQFEAMYQKMFQTQGQWGEQQVPHDDLFRSFAAELSLDLERYDRDYADPATAARVRADFDDGLALGVQGTPTFFLNGERLRPQSIDDLTDALDDALR